MPEFFELEIRDIVPKTPGKKCCWMWVLILAIVSLSLLGASRQQLGQFKIGLTRNKVTGVVDMDTVYEPGRYFIGFWSEFVQFYSTLNTILFSDERPEKGVQQLSILNSRDRDGKRIRLDISIQYRLKKSSIGKIYRDFTTQYEDVYISELRGGLARAANLFEIAQAWENFTHVQNLLHAACTKVLEPRYAECWGLQLWGIKLEDRYEKALVRTQVRKQAKKTEERRKLHTVARAMTQVMLAEFRKNITIISSNGTANRLRIERSANSTALAELIRVQGRVLDTVKGNITVGAQPMTPTQLINYQRFMMLDRMKDVSLVVHNPGSYMNQMGVQSAKPR
eukprot:TRINITY_DN15065_c0_g3_i1.p1 TRINITY_DN15065_c0_g3~~TRINITY_DN15065_c0_g3_i1.p1  ORF type:complete len:338 (-),score=39.40 TRINITY_DN15065_c0_g3_i1:262-1275(-)